MTSRSDPTWTAIEAYAKYVANEYVLPSDAGPVIQYIDNSTWVADEVGALRRGSRRTFMAHRLVRLLDEDPTGHCLRSQATSAVKSDRRFSGWMGGMIGTAMGTTASSSDWIVDLAVHSQVSQEDGSLTEDIPRVREDFDRFVNFGTAEYQNSTVLAPLPGCKLPKRLKSFQIADGIELVRFTDDEYIQLANQGIIKPMFASEDYIGNEHRIGFRIDIPTRIVRHQPGHFEREMLNWNLSTRPFGSLDTWAFSELVEELVFCVRLNSPVRVIHAGSVLGSAKGSIGGSTFHMAPKLHRFPMAAEYTLSRATLEKVSSTWTSLTSKAVSRRLPQIVVRRFNQAIDRHGSEDAIVDMMIAAEALFLGDRSDDTAELGYRMKQRAACLVRSVRYPVKDTMKLMSEAYGLRSRIVHGVKDPFNRKKQSPIEPNEFGDRLADLMRTALKRAIKECESGKPFGTPEYWTNLVLRP